MELLWSPRSPFVRKVMIVLHETNQVDDLTLERNVVAMAAPNDTVMKSNPLNKIPTLVLDDGTVLFDSRVICEFFDRRHAGPRLFPGEPEAYFQALTRQAVGDGLMDLLLVWRNWFQDRELPFNDTTDPYLRAFALKTDTTLNTLELAAPGLAATPLSIGHVSIGCALGLLDFRWPDIDWRGRRPALAAWYTEFAQRPSMRTTAPVHDTPSTEPGGTP